MQQLYAAGVHRCQKRSDRSARAPLSGPGHWRRPQPWASPTNWHTDQQMDPYWAADATMVWISLDAATAQNGALCFLPGTQRQANSSTAPVFRSS